MDARLEIALYVLGFIVALNVFARVMFNGIFGARVRESKINNKDNPNAKK